MSSHTLLEIPNQLILDVKSSKIPWDVIAPRYWNIGLVSSGVSLTSWAEGASLALGGHPSSDGMTIKMLYWVDVLFHAL